MRTAQTEIIIEKHVFENRQSKHLAYTHMCIAAQHAHAHTPRVPLAAQQLPKHMQLAISRSGS